MVADSDGKLHISYRNIWDLNLKYATNSNGSFQVETVDPDKFTGRYNSIALDADDKPHIAYFDFVGGDLKYAEKTAGTWQRETAVSTGIVGSFPSIKIDQNGYAHISYKDDGTTLYYATNKDGFWFYEPVAQSKNISTLLIDSSEYVHLIYTGDIGGLMHSSTNDLGQWIHSPVDTSTEIGDGSSATISAQGHIHVSYYASNYEVLYATNKTGAWITEVIDPELLLTRTSIHLSDSGEVHIAQFSLNIEASRMGLHYGVRNDTGWDFERIDSGDVWIPGTSIALDSQGSPTISYRDDNRGFLLAKDLGSDWGISLITEEIIGSYSSLIYDLKGHPALSIYSDAGDEIQSYSRSMGNWVVHSIDDSDNTPNSIFADTQGYLHVVYCIGDALMYGNNAGGVWGAELVDSNVTLGSDRSLTIDGDGNAHVVYSRQFGDTLPVYATNKTGSWITTTLDSTGQAGRNTSIVLDEQGFIHVSYQSIVAGNNQLRYSTNMTGAIVSVVIDESDNTQDNAGIAVDADGFVHIVFHATWDEGLYHHYGLKYASNKSGVWKLNRIGQNGLGFNAHSLALGEDGVIHLSAQGYYGLWYMKIPAGYSR